MPYFPSLSEDDRVAHALKKFNIGVEKPLMELHQVLLRREDSSWTIGERELIAAYVSGISSCNYCFGSHSKVASLFGIDSKLFDSLFDDFDNASLDKKLKAVLIFVRKLTLEPSKIGQGDIDKVFEAGCDEEAFYEAIMVCCAFNFMNRFVMALGLEASDIQSFSSAKQLEGGYDQIIEKFNLK